MDNERASDTEETFSTQDPPGNASDQNAEESEGPEGGPTQRRGGSSGQRGKGGGNPGGSGEQSQATGNPGNAG